MKLRYLLVIAAVYTSSALSMPAKQEKSCMGKTCLFASCFFNGLENIIEFGENTIEILEANNPNFMEKAIFDVVIKLLDLSKPALIALAASCKSEAEKIDAEHIPVLSSLGLVDSSGVITNQQVRDVVNSTIKVTSSVK